MPRASGRPPIDPSSPLAAELTRRSYADEKKAAQERSAAAVQASLPEYRQWLEDYQRRKLGANAAAPVQSGYCDVCAAEGRLVAAYARGKCRPHCVAAWKAATDYNARRNAARKSARAHQLEHALDPAIPSRGANDGETA